MSESLPEFWPDHSLPIDAFNDNLFGAAAQPVNAPDAANEGSAYMIGPFRRSLRPALGFTAEYLDKKARLYAEKMRARTQYQYERRDSKSLPERIDGEETTTYLRRIFELTPEEKDGLNNDCATLVTKVSRMYGHRARTAAINDTDFLKWRFMGEPNEPLPRVISISEGHANAGISFSSELVEIQNKHLARVDKIASDNKEAITELFCEDVKNSPQYAFLASFMDIPEQPVPKDVPLPETVKITNTASRKEKLSEEYGIGINEIDTTWSPAAFAIRQELRHFHLQQDLLTTRQIQPEAKVKDPFLRLREWSAQKVGFRRQVYDSGNELVLRTVGGHPDKLTRKEIGEQFPPDRNEIPNINSIVDEMLWTSFQNGMGESYVQALNAEVRRLGLAMANSLTDSYCVGDGKSMTEELIWLRKPQYIEHEPTKPFLKQNNTGNSMVNNDTMEALDAIKIAHITRHEYSREYEEKTRLLFWERATTLPEVADVNPSLTLHFPATDVNGEAQNFIPHGMDPCIPGYTIIAARQMTDGREFDFAESEDDPYEPCGVSLQDHQQRLSDHFDQVEGGLQLIANELRTRNIDLTVEQLICTIKDTSGYGLTDGKTSRSIVVHNGVAYMQCKGAADLLSEAINKVCGPISYVVQGLAIAPGEDAVTLLGHAQVVVQDDGREYFCDATPSAQTQILDPNYLDALLLSMQINALDLSGPTSSTPTLPAHQPAQMNQHLIAEGQVAPAAEEESADQLVTARQVIDAYPQWLESSRSMLEDAIRVRLNLESDSRYSSRDTLYSRMFELFPRDDHPLRVALESAGLAKVSAQKHSYISSDESRAKTQQTLEWIQHLQTVDPMAREQAFKCADDVTLATLKSNLEQMLHKQHEFAWARQTLQDIVS